MTPMPLYETDLAMIQAASFGGHAAVVAPWLVARLRASHPSARRILDVGCGAGVSSRTFTDAGFEVIGFDPSDALLQHARRAAPRATFSCRSAYGGPLPRADAVVAIGEPLTYHAPETDAEAALLGFFEAAAACLPDGGLLSFDVIVTEGAALDARSFRSEADWFLASETVEDRAAGRLARNVETFVRDPETGAYRRRRETHHVRLFPEQRVEALLREAGFTLEEATRTVGDHALLPRRVLFVAVSARARA
jgi:SAM-dependent methyltransferase